ncbi:MAG: histidine kinase dimerization/phosphoacceptor domain -containing protein [Bacteroidota bacterium]
MKMYFLVPIVFFALYTRVSFAQYTPNDRCVEDSLSRTMPRESQVERAEFYLRLAKMWDSVPQKSYNYILLAMPISIHENNINLKARTRMALGDYCVGKRRFIEAMEHYEAALKQYHWAHNETGEMAVLRQIGSLNGNLGTYNVALTYFNEGLEIAKNTRNMSMQGTFRNQIAVIYQQMGNYHQSMLFFQQALLDFRIAGKKVDEMNVQNNIGNLLLDQRRYDEALVHYSWLITKGDTSDNNLMGTVYTRMAHIYSEKNDHLTSLNYNRRALAKRQQIHSASGVSSSLINISGDFFHLGQLDSGRFYNDLGMRIAIQNNWRNYIENGYRHLYQYYLTHGNYEEALTYYHLYSAESERISQERSKSNINILEARRQIQRIQESENLLIKEHKIQSLNISNQLYQFSFVKSITALAGIIVVIFLVVFLISRQVRRKMQGINKLLSAEILERKAAERQTSERERQYRFLTENSADFIAQTDEQKIQIYTSPSSLKLFGYNQLEIMGKSLFFLTHPDYQAYTESVFNGLTETRSPRQITYQARKKDGTFFWVESIINPLFDPVDGIFKGVVTVTRNIQERKTKEFEIMEGTKQKENLLKEIHHRVKNNFAILVSLINMQLAQSKNPELVQSLTNLQLRIRTMALVHEMLYRSKDFESISFLDYLRSLASVIAGTFNRHDIVLTFEAQDSVIDIEAAIPLGLIVNEILSNAYMHAFPDNRAGHIRISFMNDTEKRMSTLVLEDDGIGMPDGLNRGQYKTMGLQIIQILCKQIEGTLTVKNNPGASFTITFQTFPE